MYTDILAPFQKQAEIVREEVMSRMREKQEFKKKNLDAVGENNHYIIMTSP